MLQGYLSLGKCIEKLQDTPDVQVESDLIEKKDGALRFYKNGSRFARQFLGEYYLLTKSLKKALEKFEVGRKEESSIIKSRVAERRKEQQEQPVVLESPKPEQKKHRSVFSLEIRTPDRRQKTPRDFVINLSSHLNSSKSFTDSVKYFLRPF